MKKYFLLLTSTILLLGKIIVAQDFSCLAMKQMSQGVYPTDSRSDSINIVHTDINLAITDFNTKIVRGFTEIIFHPRVSGVNQIRLDLLKMNIDSVLFNQNLLNSYNYNDSLIKCNLPQSFSIGDTLSLKIYYNGIPQTDPSGFGGFYFQNNIAYNLGVGFQSIPHNYGRVWFPCFDNFTERFTVNTNITTLNNHKAFCGGMLQDQIFNSDNTITWKWSLNKTIPSYLVSVAVGAYATVNQYFNSTTGIIPVQLGALAADTTLMKNAFTNLDDCFQIFNDKFGDYMFPRIGYVMVPFNSGAMEHATNIAYPRLALNAGLQFESVLMAHELAHMWFGDLVTCRTAEDMWLNEGWASFCAMLFNEIKYNRELYESDIKTNRDRVLQFAHYSEGGFQPISGVPQQYTYGLHSYQKGADVLNTLRTYLGDEPFFNGSKNLLIAKKFTDISAIDFRNFLQEATGQNLVPFFNEWVFKGGFVNVTVDSFQTTQLSSNQFAVKVFLKQRLKGRSELMGTFPVELSLYDESGNKTTKMVDIDELITVAEITHNVEPKLILVNESEKTGLASIGTTKIVSASGSQNFAPTKVTSNITAVSSTTPIRVTHHYTAPDGFKQPQGYRLSPERYYTIEALPNAIFTGTALFPYNGRANSASGNFYLDTLLINQTEDSLVLMFRKNAADDWQEYPKYTLLKGNVNDKFGNVRIDSLTTGEFTLAMKDFTAHLPHVKKRDSNYIIYPNPTSQILNFYNAYSNDDNLKIDFYNNAGQLVYSTYTNQSKGFAQLNIETLSPGFYTVYINNSTCKKLIKTN